MQIYVGRTERPSIFSGRSEGRDKNSWKRERRKRQKEASKGILHQCKWSNTQASRTQSAIG